MHTDQTREFDPTKHDYRLAKIWTTRYRNGACPQRHEDPSGIYFEASPPHHGQAVAFLFPGQGSQSVGMLGDLAIAFPEVRRAFDDFDIALSRSGRPRVGPLVFPPPAFDEAGRARANAALRATNAAQAALGA